MTISFNYSGSMNSNLNDRDGGVVTILRKLTNKEADLIETGLMYRVRFGDGFESDVFADELEYNDYDELGEVSGCKA